MPRYATPQSRPLHLPGRTVFVGDVELFVREAGPAAAEPLVLLHGWNLDGEHTYHGVIPGLSERFRIVMPDLRDHGRSEWRRTPVDLADLADDVAGLLDALGLVGATVVGYSLGGMVAQVLAVRHPRLVGRLVLAATSAYPVDRLRPAAWAVMRVARTVARISRRELTMATVQILRGGRALRPEHERWMWEGLMRRDPALSAEVGFAAWRFDGRASVPAIAVPTLVIVPSRDQVIPPRAQRALVDLLANATMIEIPGARHEAILAEPETFVDAITKFVTG
jgi:pimeloyl-ACP methyl ester carboxylesterase